MSGYRQCGGCSECCRTMPVAELPGGPKARGVTCPAQRPEGGCASYEQRPRSCREFRCLWLEGYAGAADRPDRTGIIFTRTELAGATLPAAWVAPAGYRGHGADLVRELAPLVIVRGEDCELIGPLALKAAVAREALKRGPRAFPGLNLADQRVRWRRPEAAAKGRP